MSGGGPGPRREPLAHPQHVAIILPAPPEFAGGHCEEAMSSMERDPPRISLALSAFGGAAIIVAVLFLGTSFYVESDIGRAFCLGGFFTGLLGAVLLFGFSKVIDMLDAIRVENRKSPTDTADVDT